MDLRFYLSIFLRRLHWFLLLAALGTAAGLAVARLVPPVYMARALLVVESEQIPGDLAASTVEVQASEQLQIIQQRILTRDTLVELANRLRVYAPVPGEPAPVMDADALVRDMRARISIVTSGGTVARGPAQATLITVSFEAPTSVMAAAVTNELVTLILKNDVEMRTGVARQTLQFFEQEVTRLDGVLAERASAILKFKEANNNALPDSQEFRRSQQTAAQLRALELQRVEADLRSQRTRLVRLYEVTGGTAAGSLVPPQQQTTEQRQLSERRDELASLRSVLSAEHPRIRLLETQVAALEKVVGQQSATGNLDAEGRELNAHEVQLNEIDTQLEAITQQQAGLEADIAALKASLEATPGNGITLDVLQRAYDSTRIQYDRAVANRATAQTGDTIEAMAKGRRIAVLEQPVPPTAPSRPNRKLIAAMGMGAGIFAGAALVVVLELLKGGIRRPEDLTNRLGITPFATLPYLESARERRAQRRKMIAIILTGIVLIAALFWATQTFLPRVLSLGEAGAPVSLRADPPVQQS